MTSRREMMEEHSKGAHQAYLTHGFIEKHPEQGRWIIGPGGAYGNLWTDIACLAGNKLYVGGDMGPLVFAYGPVHPVARVLWLAKERSPADPVPKPDGYFMEKATIGMCAHDMVYEWNDDAALSDLADLLEDEEDEDIRESMGEDIRSSIRCNDRQAVYDDLSRYGHDDCDYFGMFPRTRVFQAYAAIHRLGLLLRAEL